MAKPAYQRLFDMGAFTPLARKTIFEQKNYSLKIVSNINISIYEHFFYKNLHCIIRHQFMIISKKISTHSLHKTSIAVLQFFHPNPVTGHISIRV